MTTPPVSSRLQVLRQALIDFREANGTNMALNQNLDEERNGSGSTEDTFNSPMSPEGMVDRGQLSQDPNPNPVGQTIQLDLAEYARLLGIAATSAVAARAPSLRPSAGPDPLPSAWVPKFTVEPFDGNPVGPGPKEFLCRAEQLQRGKGIPERIFVANHVPTLLTGAALQWYYAQPRFVSWNAFKAALMAQYQLPNQDDCIWEVISNRFQGKNETVSDYVADISAKFQLLNTPATEKEQVRQVFRNLLPDLRLQMCTKTYVSVRQLVADALQVEATLQLTASARLSSTNSSQSTSRPSPSNSFQPSGWMDYRDRACYNCGIKGHIASKCRLPRREGASQQSVGNANRVKQPRSSEN